MSPEDALTFGLPAFVLFCSHACRPQAARVAVVTARRRAIYIWRVLFDLMYDKAT